MKWTKKWYSEFLVGTWGDYLCTVYLFVNGGRRLYRGVLTYNGKVLYKVTRPTDDLVYDNLNVVGALLDRERRQWTTVSRVSKAREVLLVVYEDRPAVLDNVDDMTMFYFGREHGHCMRSPWYVMERLFDLYKQYGDGLTANVVIDNLNMHDVMGLRDVVDAGVPGRIRDVLCEVWSKLSTRHVWFSVNTRELGGLTIDADVGKFAPRAGVLVVEVNDEAERAGAYDRASEYLHKINCVNMSKVYTVVLLDGQGTLAERRDNICGDEELELVTKELLDKYGTLPKYLW